MIYKLRLAIYRFRLRLYNWLKDGISEIQVSDDRLKLLQPDVADAVRNLYGIKCPANRDLGIQMLEDVYKTSKDPEAATYLAFVYLYDFDDPCTALDWFVETVKSGGWWANYRIAQMLEDNNFEASYLENLSVKNDAAHYYQIGIDLGHLPSGIRMLEIQRDTGKIGMLSYYFQKIPYTFFTVYGVLRSKHGYKSRMY